LETCQTTGALNILANPVVSVATCSALPNAAVYTGRMIYVDDENRYYYALDGVWLNKFDSEPFNYANVAWAWGSNNSGQLADNNFTSRSSPVSVVGGFSDWFQVVAGGYHSLGVRTGGSAWTWGCNDSGRLGDNSTINRSSPVSVVGGFTDWCQTSAGGCHSLAVRTGGTTWGWGANLRGQLGTGNTTSTSSPVSVVGGFSDWCQISGGDGHSLGVRTGGTAWAWGCNNAGHLGDNTTTVRPSPVSVVGGFSDWCQLDAGYRHSLGVRTNGSAWTWGCNDSGRLGDNSTINRSSPVSVVGGFTDWCQVSGGNRHSLGIRTSGSAWAWGFGISGQLGDNTTTDRSSPVSVVGGFTDWYQVSAGADHSLGVRTNGTVWAWGCNGNGRLGDNTITNRVSPVSVVGGFSDWCQASAGCCHSLAIRQRCKGF
jgi:alpha-tubulin suppressor-like RCC1 family protein